MNIFNFTLRIFLVLSSYRIEKKIRSSETISFTNRYEFMSLQGAFLQSIKLLFMQESIFSKMKITENWNKDRISQMW